MPSGKHRVLSVSGRHNDDRWRNAPGVFRKAFETFFNFRYLPIFTDISRRLPRCIIPGVNHRQTDEVEQSANRFVYIFQFINSNDRHEI